MYFISLLGLIWNIGLLFQAFIALSRLRSLKSAIAPNCNNFVQVLVPVRNEEVGHVQECIKYFLTQKSISKVTICLTEIDNDHKRYLEILHGSMDIDSRLTYVTYKGPEGYKAEQINVALNRIIDSGEDVIVGIYDIDSKPDSKVFEYVKRNKIEVGQQPILYDANLNDLGLLTTAGSLHQTSWAIGFEMYNLIFPKSRLVYTVGHGLFLSSNVLKTCGLFEEKCITEDLMFGYKASVAKMKFQIIPYYEHAKFVKKLSDFIPQSARWFRGELELVYRFPEWFDKFEGGLSDKKKYLLRLIELMWWPFERIVYIATLIGAFLGLISVEFALLYTSVLVMSGYLSTVVVIKNGGRNTRLLIAPLLIPIWHCVSVMGPIIAIIKRISGTQVGWIITKK